MDADPQEPLTVLVKKIERYLTDRNSVFKEPAITEDIFDLTLSSESKQFKCTLHPKLNYLVYKGVLTTSAIIHVTKYSTHVDETVLETPVRVTVFTDLCVVYDDNTVLPVKDEYLRNQHRRNRPLLTSREYYLPLYNSDDIYGIIWEMHRLKLKPTELNAANFISIGSLQRLQHPKRNQLSPVIGTVITKSKIVHFGKSNDTHCKYPFKFSIEIEHNNYTCNVTFWNKSCLHYFKSIQVGQSIVLKQYRLKKRYETRSNTVFTPSKDSGMELSINPANPKGEVELAIKLSSNRVLYRFVTSLAVGCNQVPPDSIVDVSGCICFVGRLEREKKNSNALSSGNTLSCGDFCMYKWLTIKDGTSDYDVNIKMYACSQSDVLERLKCGDILVAARLLCKIGVVSYLGKPTGQTYLTSSKETQLYSFNNKWTLNEIEEQPFVKSSAFLNVLKWSSDSAVQEKLLQNSRNGGYFTYPYLPDELNNYKALNGEFDVTSASSFVELCEKMHIHQTVRVNIQATIAAIEFVTGGDDSVDGSNIESQSQKLRRSTRLSASPDTSSQSSQGEERFRVIDKETIELCDNIESVGDMSLDEEGIKEILGYRSDQQISTILRFLLIGLNKKVAILALFIPNETVTSAYNTIYDVLKGKPATKTRLGDTSKFLDDAGEAVKPNERFLFVLDVYHSGEDHFEVILNRAFQL